MIPLPTDAPGIGRDDLRLLAEIGFVAAGAKNVRCARRIFEALQVLEPHRTYPFLGLAMTAMSVGKPDAAIKLLRDHALQLDPKDEEAMLFLGIALRDAKQSAESEKVLNQLKDMASPDSPAARLARSLTRASSAGQDPSAAPTEDDWAGPAQVWPVPRTH